MKITANYNKIPKSFQGKRPNDSTYRVIKNPETASDAMERGFVNDFIKRNPNWEQDEELVHRLKQDTKWARAKGKIPSQWHEFDDYPGVAAVFFSAVSILSSLFLYKNRNVFSKMDKATKILLPIGSLGGAYIAADSIKYILTGRNLFERKQNNKS